MAAKKKKTTAKKATKRKANNKTSKTQSTSWFRFAVKWCFVIGFWVTLAVVALCAYYATELPNITIIIFNFRD